MYARKRIEPYGSILYFANDTSDWRKLGIRYGLTDWEDGPCAMGRTEELVGYPDYQHHVIVWVDTNPKFTDACIINTITHEASHAAGQILNRIGQEHTGDSECFTYLLGFITEWIYKEWQKSKLKEKNHV